jgi:predicted PP-loop superfamily ATPase
MDVVGAMLKEPLTEQELRTWLTRREIMSALKRLRTCHNGHARCSTHEGGPCHARLLDRIQGAARDRALDMVACGDARAQVQRAIIREYPALGQDTLDLIVDEAFSLAKAD